VGPSNRIWGPVYTSKSWCNDNPDLDWQGLGEIVINYTKVLYFTGETTIMGAVYGPVEVKPMKLQIDRASVDAVFRSKSGLPCKYSRYSFTFSRYSKLKRGAVGR
jgi:hypothetical protein